MKLNKKNIFYIFFISISFLSLYLFFQLNFFRHWSANLDQDFTLIYNSLILNSGYKSEYQDHPGHTQILFISIWLSILKLLSLIKFSGLDELMQSTNLLSNFNDIVLAARFSNLIILFSYIFLIFKILKNISPNYKLIYFFLLFFVLSNGIINSVSIIRTEFISSLFIFFTLFFMIKLVSSSSSLRKNIFLLGVCFTLSIFSKFQSLVVFVFLPFFVLTMFEKKITKYKLMDFEKKNYFPYFNLFFLFGVILLLLKYAQGINYIFLPIGIIYLFFIGVILNKKYFKNKIFPYQFLFYFFSGVLISTFVLVILRPFHTQNIAEIVNALGFSNMFVQGTNPYNFSLFSFLSNISSAANNFVKYFLIVFSNFTSESLLLILIFILTATHIFKKNKKEIYVSLLTFISLILIMFIFSVRPSSNYIIYFSPILFFSCFYLIRNININIISFFISLIFIIMILPSISAKILSHKYYSQTDEVCSKEIILNKYSYIRWWHKKIDPDFIYKICEIKN